MRPFFACCDLGILLCRTAQSTPGARALRCAPECHAGMLASRCSEQFEPTHWMKSGTNDTVLFVSSVGCWVCFGWCWEVVILFQSWGLITAEFGRPGVLKPTPHSL